jgi:hypothetical protein
VHELDEIFDIYVPKDAPNRAAFRRRLQGIIKPQATATGSVPITQNFNQNLPIAGMMDINNNGSAGIAWELFVKGKMQLVPAFGKGPDGEPQIVELSLVPKNEVMPTITRYADGQAPVRRLTPKGIGTIQLTKKVKVHEALVERSKKS